MGARSDPPHLTESFSTDKKPTGELHWQKAIQFLQRCQNFPSHNDQSWAKNAGDTRYVPIAIPYPGFAPSGFIGESGRPRTAGVSIGFTF